MGSMLGYRSYVGQEVEVRNRWFPKLAVANYTYSTAFYLGWNRIRASLHPYIRPTYLWLIRRATSRRRNRHSGWYDQWEAYGQ